MRTERDTRLEPALERAHDPRVDGGAVGGGGDLDLRLQKLGQAQGDSGREGVVRAQRLSGLGLLLLDVDELGLAADEANLDASGNLGGERERELSEQVEQAQVERGLDRLGEPVTGLARGVVARDGGRVGEILLKRLNVRCHLHGRTMTS